MTKLELFFWAGAAWCFGWGVYETLMLTRLRRAHRLTAAPTWVALLYFAAALLQAVGLTVFLMCALWLHTARALGL